MSKEQNHNSNSAGSFMDFFQGIDYRNAIKANSSFMECSQEYDSKNFKIIHETNGDIYEGEVIKNGN